LSALVTEVTSGLGKSPPVTAVVRVEHAGDQGDVGVRVDSTGDCGGQSRVCR